MGRHLIERGTRDDDIFSGADCYVTTLLHIGKWYGVTGLRIRSMFHVNLISCRMFMQLWHLIGAGLAAVNSPLCRRASQMNRSSVE
jgi:hypothetical protein